MAYFRRDDLLGPITDFDAERTYMDRRIGTARPREDGLTQLIQKMQENTKREVECNLRNIAKSYNVPIREDPFIMPKYIPDIPL